MSRLGKKLPVRALGMASSRSPACVVRVSLRCLLLQVVRASVRSPGSAPMRVVVLVSINSCRARWATTLINSIPSAVRSESMRRSKSGQDKVVAQDPVNSWF
ncbi:hypothetical protein UK12_14380 [Saccharothrix sp. ST-888]|nr:hypothetical protein UK12_14380 [Saccharothrix sp. ST-888]